MESVYELHHLPSSKNELMIKTIIELFTQTQTQTQTLVTPLQENEPFHITAITLTGRLLTIQIRPFDKVIHIKQQIFQQDGLLLDQQRLVFNGKNLEDDTCIHEYGINAESRIHLILRLRGGMFHASSSRNDYLSYKSKEIMEKGLSMIKYMRNKYPPDMMDKIHTILLECNERDIECIVKVIEQYYVI